MQQIARFCWQEISLCQKCIWSSQNLHITLYADLLQKQRKNKNIRRNGKHRKHLSKRIEQRLFSTRHGLWCVKRSNKKNSFRQSIVQQVIDDTYNLYYDGYCLGLASIVYKCFDELSKHNAINTQKRELFLKITISQ